MMPDVAGDAAVAARALDWVGMRNIALPLRVRGDDGALLQVPASVDVLVDLRNPDGSWLSGTPGLVASLIIPRCSIDLRGVTSSKAGTDLTLTVPTRFSGSFTGNHTVFVRAVNQVKLDTSWRIGGNWSR